MVALLAVYVAQLTDVDDPRRSFAAGEKDVVLMLDPIDVCDGRVDQYVWSTDGSGLVATREVVDATPSQVASAVSVPKGSAKAEESIQTHSELVQWSARTGKPRVVLGAVPPGARVEGLWPMAGSDRVFVQTTTALPSVVSNPRRFETVTMLAVATGAATRVWEATEEGGDGLWGAAFSPRRPTGALIWQGLLMDQPLTARLVGPSGKLGPVIGLPKGATFGFDERGYPGAVAGRRSGDRYVRSFQSLDATTGRLGVARELPPREREAEGPVWVAERAASAEGVRSPTVLLCLAGGKPTEAGVVTTDGRLAQLSPTADAVAYVSQGALRVRPIVRIAREAYELALRQAAKREALGKAKQIGLSVLMYGSDHGDNYPGPDANLQQILGPYLKDPNMLNGFSYTFRGGSAESVASPAETELGFVSGPGGRAVLYADGHAKWISDKP